MFFVEMRMCGGRMGGGGRRLKQTFAKFIVQSQTTYLHPYRSFSACLGCASAQPPLQSSIIKHIFLLCLLPAYCGAAYELRECDVSGHIYIPFGTISLTLSPLHSLGFYFYWFIGKIVAILLFSMLILQMRAYRTLSVIHLFRLFVLKLRVFVSCA